MTKKIEILLDKYKSEDWCQNIIISTNQNIQETINELKDIQNNLSQKLHDINLSEQLEDDKIISDLQNDIKTTKELVLHFIDLKQSIFNMIEKDDTILFDDKRTLYMITDDLCPVCNAKLYTLKIDYKRFRNETVYYETLNGYCCPCCNRLFILQNEIDNNISFKNTNININLQYLDNEVNNRQLIFKDVIVLSNLISCTTKDHNLKDVLVQIPIFNVDGSITFINVNISYCSQCDKYIMLKSDFKNINGIVACEVIDQTTIRNKNDSDDIEIKQYESVLYKYGYNVKTKDNLSDRQRHLILASVVESGILTREQICSHLDTLIERGSKIEKWKLATEKWKQDRHYVKKYSVNSLPSVLLNKIILKYSQLSLLDI